jgi:hypothetical protein
MQQWKYPSSSGPGEYTTTLAADGLLSCDCRGFLIKKKDKPRYCRHTDHVVRKLGLNIVQKGDYQYAVDPSTAVQQTIIPQVDHATNYQTAKDHGYINPMLAIAPTKGQTVDDFDPETFVMEEKYDGERKIVSKKLGQVFTWNRPRSGKGEVGKEDPLPDHIQQAVLCLPDGTYDGELIAPGGKSWDVANLANVNNLKLVLFDVLRLGDESLLQLPYMDRRKLLAMAVDSLVWPNEPYIIVSPIGPPIQAEVQKIWDRGGEGAILKRKNATYRPGWRSTDWVKIKLVIAETFTVIGYTKGKNGPYSSVNLRSDDGIETRCKTKDNDWLRLFETDPNKYIGKRIVIEHQGRTPDRKFRHPMWKEMTLDHMAGEGE